MGVYTTMNIAPYSDLQFEGASYSHATTNLFTNFLAWCDQTSETEMTCFDVDEPGWLTLDFNGPTLLSAFFILSNNNFDEI